MIIMIIEKTTKEITKCQDSTFETHHFGGTED